LTSEDTVSIFRTSHQPFQIDAV